MRVKCPNSDIYLDLPNDRMDMKFTCPACKKIHRVTITIATPGEAAPDPRKAPPMPKKYATGAYAPVVDVPIDADFVLFDGSAEKLGIDLGQAAAPVPPFIDRRMSERKTEIMRDPPRRPADAGAAAPAGADPEPRAERREEEGEETPPGTPHAFRSAALRSWIEEDGAPLRSGAGQAGDPVPAAPGGGPVEPDGPAPSAPSRPAAPIERAFPRHAPSPRRGRGMAAALFFAMLALAGAGYLGWQQYRFNLAAAGIDARLADAERDFRRGDIEAAGAAADAAEGEQLRRRNMHTLENVWNRVAPAVGLPGIRWTDYALADRMIGEHVERRRVFGDFSRELDSGEAGDVAPALEKFGSASAAPADSPLLRAFQERAVKTALDKMGVRNGAPLPPEEALNDGTEVAKRLGPLLDPSVGEAFGKGLGRHFERQGERLRGEFRLELSEIAALAARSDAAALDRYAALGERARSLPPSLRDLVFDRGEPDVLSFADGADLERLGQVAGLSAVVGEAHAAARSILSAEGPIDDELDRLAEKARAESSPDPVLAGEAARRVEAAGADGDLLLSLREDLFLRLQSENRRGSVSPGTMIAWSLVRPAFGDSQVRIDPHAAEFAAKTASVDMVFHGTPLHVSMTEEDYETGVRASAYGYALSAGWSPLLYKPLSWMAEIARGLYEAGVDPVEHPEWKVMEGPGGLAAVTPRRAPASASAYGSVSGDGGRRLLFFAGGVHPVRDLPQPGGADAHGEAFREAARRLHEGVMGDESIPQPLRQALAPVLMGTYLPIDPRDYLDAEFCRRLVEADYLESVVKPLPPERQADLDAYRGALDKLEAGCDVFVVALGDGRELYATARLEDGETRSSAGNDQDPDTGETLPEYEWRLEGEDATTFYSPLPARYVYAFSLAERYPGGHRVRPPGMPSRVEVWHAVQGLAASFDNGDNEAEGNRDVWERAVESDVGGQLPPVYGPPGWNFPLHVLVRNDQGDPILIATPGGVVRSPDFSGFDDPGERRIAENEWLDHTARIFSTPGELGLIFHQFFRYCSDSPLPEDPNLIGSHFGHLDTHQTVYESLERRWVGRLIGDCDDLAEFFQVLTARQGKLSQVMNLPAHAACGYVDDLPGGGYRFVVLQTGNTLQFAGSTLNEAVEAAYRSFDRDGGETHMTMDAVPIFLRFADEETRTPFILSSRIYADREYAEAMIRVQGYWHQYVFSAAIREMEEMLKTDREVGNIKELGSLYQRVSLYDKSAELRRRELESVRGDVQATLSTLLEIAQLHYEAKEREESLKALGEMEAVFRDIIDRQDAPTFMKVMSFRSYWAMHLAQLGDPARAWGILQYDVDAAKGQRGYVNSDPLLRTLVVLYDKLAQMRDGKDGLSAGDETVMRQIGREIEAAASRALFKADDYYNLTIMRYYMLGRYAVAKEGRRKGLARLLEDGPYPAGQRNHAKRAREISDEDWAWFRIAPALYLSYAQEMLDPEENPELYDPEAARRLLERVPRAALRGTGFGSDIAGADDIPKSRLILAFLNRDLGLYRSTMAEVKDKNYSSLYDDAAMTFGAYAGLIPLGEFNAWIAAFREYFPGRQHYFKVVYRAVDKENFDHALMMADAFAGFFPNEKLLVEEAAFVRNLVPHLKAGKEARRAAKAAERKNADAPEARAGKS